MLHNKTIFLSAHIFLDWIVILIKYELKLFCKADNYFCKLFQLQNDLLVTEQKIIPNFKASNSQFFRCEHLKTNIHSIWRFIDRANFKMRIIFNFFYFSIYLVQKLGNYLIQQNKFILEFYLLIFSLEFRSCMFVQSAYILIYKIYLLFQGFGFESGFV